MKEGVADSDLDIDLGRVAIVALAVAVLLGLAAIFRPVVVGTLLILVGFFIVIVTLHEFGHFVMAKRAGMKVTEFFAGFGPRLWSVRRGETEYGVKALPLGGYVRIIGMTNLEAVDPEDEPRAYRNGRFRDRVGVAVAGPATHFLLVLVLIFALLVTIGDPRERYAKPEVGEVLSDTPAETAGFEAEDEVVAVDGEPVTEWAELPELVEDRGGEELTVTVRRDGALVDLAVVPEEERVDGETVARIGVANSGEAVQPGTVAPLAAIPATFEVFADSTVQSLEALGRIFSPSGMARYVDTVFSGGEDESGEQSQERFLSPIGFGRVAGQAVDSGWYSVLVILIVINLFVGLFNLIPLLPFDGGHVAIAVYERIASAVKGRTVHADVAKLLPITTAVLMVLGFILVSSIFLDITNPLENPF